MDFPDVISGTLSVQVAFGNAKMSVSFFSATETFGSVNGSVAST
jgi:hypothetical protein